MLEINSIKFSVFSYVTEENQRVVQALKNCLPTNLRSEKLEKQSIQNQFGDPIFVYSYLNDEEEEVSSIIQYIASNLDDKNKEYLGRHLTKRIDLENRRVYLRLDKFKAYEGELYITEGSDVIKLEIQYTAYTQSENSINEVVEIFKVHNFIKL